VFALLVPSLLEQGVNNLTLMALSDLLQDCANKFVTANSHDITILCNFCIDEDGPQLENIWKIGVKHPKSKQLLMRHATTGDKKAKGAGSRSFYYLIHGHPEQQKRKGTLVLCYKTRSQNDSYFERDINRV
jgi:hypothetical protein